MKWHFEKIQELALKCKTRSEFKHTYLQAYRAAIKLKILDIVCSHMPIKVYHSGKTHSNYKWTDNSLHQIALKYNTRIEFIKGDNPAYLVACRRKIINKICSHMEYVHYPWKDWELQEVALKYKTRIDFAEYDDNAYQTAQNRGILDKICAHMEYIIYPWEDKELYEEALKYDNRKDFYNYSNGAYSTANKRGILDEVCKHMKKSSCASYMELELIGEIKKIIPSVKKKRIRTINIPIKPYIKGFELDILNKETNKAIEFDGKYHHSFEYMRKSLRKVQWSDEDLLSYHEIKDTYFLKYQNIQVLHVKEEDWLRDKAYCIKLSIAWLSNNCSVWPKSPKPLDF